ncbi:MAG: hypothetical protein KatS3mg073_1114 [Meiothermus sp.]|nr:MAG: hypothetical protein KatS3mg073_1114 [Meiothermus sp.]
MTLLYEMGDLGLESKLILRWHMFDQHLQIENVKVRKLVEDYRSGRIMIPEFQREYVWKPSRAAKLIDSLYRNFPISTILLWTGNSEIVMRRSDPRPQRWDEVSWLIDGQQRLITLSKVIYGGEGIDVVFNPNEKYGVFSLFNAAKAKDQKNWFHVSQILDDDQFRQLRRNLPEGKTGEGIERKLEDVRRILDYEVPVIKMVGHSLEDAVEAFTRINTLGVKLKTEDILSAKVAARHTRFIRDEVVPFLSRIRGEGFRRISVMHLFRACAFVAKPDARNRTPLHELGKSEITQAWNKTKLATRETISLVKSEFGLVNMDILWSGALLVPIIALNAITSPRDRDVKSMAGWMALAALFHRYSGASEAALEQDLRACRSTDPIGNLLRNLRRDIGSVSISSQEFEGSILDKGGLFGLYVACRHKGLKDLFTGKTILIESKVDRHHIFPRSQFLEKDRPRADTLANIAFVSNSINTSIKNSVPEVYLPQIDRRILESQCIPLDESLWRMDRAEEFWEARRELLAKAFNEFIKETLPGRRV